MKKREKRKAFIRQAKVNGKRLAKKHCVAKWHIYKKRYIKEAVATSANLSPFAFSIMHYIKEASLHKIVLSPWYLLIIPWYLLLDPIIPLNMTLVASTTGILASTSRAVWAWLNVDGFVNATFAIAKVGATVWVALLASTTGSFVSNTFGRHFLRKPSFCNNMFFEGGGALKRRPLPPLTPSTPGF